MSWEGPHKIGDYLGSVAHSPWKRPPERAGVYVVSEKPWRDVPTEADKILYVGQAAYLRYQIQAAAFDLLGFTGDNPSPEEAYQHKGGNSVWTHYCLPHQIEPAKLYLGWCSECLCVGAQVVGLSAAERQASRIERLLCADPRQLSGKRRSPNGVSG